MLQNAFQDLATDERVDETAALLRRLIKIMESQATVDQQNRQRITLDAITAALTLATVTTVGTVSTLTAIDGENHRMFIDLRMLLRDFSIGMSDIIVFTELVCIPMPPVQQF